MERVFKWFTYEGGDPRAGIYTNWFARYFEPKDFDGIDRLLVCFIRYCAHLSIVPRKEFLQAYLKVDGKQDIKRYNVKTETMISLDYKEASQLEEAYQIISDATQAQYDAYVQADLTDRDFKVDIYDFMSSKRSDMIQDVMLKAYPRLTDGTDIGEVSADLRSSLAELDDVYNTDKIKDVDYSSAEEEEGKLEFLCKTGIPCIDGDIGGIYTRLIYTLTSQPKGGKTRLGEVAFAYKVMTEAKKDVLWYELELSKAQTENIMVAFHITRVYGGRIKIPDNIMNKYDEMTDEQKQIYESAKIDLFESGNYGKFIFREDLVVENYLEEAENIAKVSGNLGLIAIDYMGLCSSVPADKWARRREQYEIITDAYEITRKLVKRLNVAALCINQYNDKGIDAAYAGKAIRSGYVQGGHIVQRHTDYDIHMTFTEEQELAGVRTLSTAGVRGAKGFRNVLLSTDLSVSIFRQEVRK
jgi:hypothetical protein